METSGESIRVLCSLCNKAKGIYRCEGCSQMFCPKHSNDHRIELNQQFEEILLANDLLHQTLNKQLDEFSLTHEIDHQTTDDLEKHLLVEEINRWEKKSIDLIRTTAENKRRELLEGATQDITQTKHRLQVLSKQLKESHEENDFCEIDLRQWMKTLDELKDELLYPTTITIQEDSTCLINNIRINRPGKYDVFEHVCRNAQIQEDGRLIVKTNPMGQTAIRGKGEYSIGKHSLFFRVEQLEQNGWIFFGIFSKTETLGDCSYGSPSSYGWSNQNQIYICGQCTTEFTLGIIENDLIVLTIDCNNRKIELLNKRLNRSMELSINLEQCPFPWQFHLNLYSLNTRVRIVLPSLHPFQHIVD